MIRIANAPVSYGAFELTVGVLPNVPGPEEVLGAIADAGYEGTELGPLGYLGPDVAGQLAGYGLALAGAFVELDFGSGDLAPLEVTLDAIDGLGARPVLADAGPRDGEVDLDGVQRAAERARERGFDPTFHHHMGTRVQTVPEIERLLDGTDVGLALDTGHLAAAGGDPVSGMRDWRARINHVHLKDVDLGVLHSSPRWEEVSRRRVFCELGTGDADLDGFLAELRGYDGWIVIEQDWVPGQDDDVAPQIAAQRRNRQWLAKRLLAA
jgi:inosose dehydratase